MQPRHRVSRTAIELIKRFEGYREKAAQLPDGRWTIGHGHTLTARQGAEVSPDDAEALLLYDLIGVAHTLNEQVFAPLTQNQFDALASFAFNLGADNFGRSGVLKRLNEGSPILAACAMELWRKAEVGGEKIVVDALVRRRAAEKALFLTPESGAWALAPSHVLKPLVDSDAFDLMPLQTPAEVTTSLDGEAIVVVREGEPVPAPVAPGDDEDDSPAKAAAEAVTARLSTIFQEPGEEPAVELTAEPESAPTSEPPFVLQPPEFEDAAAAEDEADEFEAEAEDETLRGPDLFESTLGAPAADVVETEDAALADLHAEIEAGEEGAPEPEPETAPEPEPVFAFPEDEDEGDRPPIPERRIIDDAVPYAFDEPVVDAISERPESGLLTVVGLAVVGLVFFGGGAVWATYARPVPESAWISPAMVGLLAGLAGALFVAVAVYLLLQRLGRASEREARYRR